ncbi:DUF3422 domain-containing protein [Marinobacter sp. CHS3-4]|uniref:DUF3422 family protein n=1 Tax=Marinobacter sp. CHS3-4 TaxID=3045174 RepID=UPI0024B48B04|nr:DUF3422 domain-containing protein [Marinobacter sp. CHS3-4]MDI9244005.1 DUF3422 domain-containing protein [Marinobacter sp. CHS3-4]
MDPTFQKLDFHPLRESLYNELHTQPFQVLPCPSQVSHLAVMTTPEQRKAQFRHWQELHEELGQPAPSEEKSCLESTFGDFKIRRELHMEFTAYTFIHFGPTGNHRPFRHTGLTSLPDGWLERLTGTVVAAFHLDLQKAEENEEPDLAVIRDYFDGYRLIGSRPAEGKARVWSSFKLHDDGFGRFMVLNMGLPNNQLGRLTQRLMEAETYRLLSLLALPVARNMTSDLNHMDQTLAEITESLTNDTGVDEPHVLAELTDMAARIEDFRAHSTFRFSATRAYHKLVLARLEALREDELSGHLTIREFMNRRLTPAAETCESVNNRLDDLSLRIGRASDMMRARVELELQRQNQELLAAMNQRSKVQLMMQHTVEGFSVVVISYYLIALLRMAMDVAEESGVSFNKPLLLGIAIPTILVLVYFTVRAIRRHFLKMAERE